MFLHLCFWSQVLLVQLLRPYMCAITRRSMIIIISFIYPSLKEIYTMNLRLYDELSPWPLAWPKALTMTKAVYNFIHTLRCCYHPIGKSKQVKHKTNTKRNNETRHTQGKFSTTIYSWPLWSSFTVYKMYLWRCCGSKFFSLFRDLDIPNLLIALLDVAPFL